ncbi:alpha-ketoglutarate-dependent dioxygenase alkB homolog 7, mitochondrial [Cuculus canorus]|uniref:alpha-ketoglutarate-dependent dioxygenase alkB homolog 7, mitochondrial n=1 Tax=Cuculus canorus TaxID=55661 RepID=UPI0023AA4B2B|nr:alpha-ketoglutarate-dependent dioxygenase alkB homolog 7, mitochondrial [Cuculus canorus]
MLRAAVRWRVPVAPGESRWCRAGPGAAAEAEAEPEPIRASSPGLRRRLRGLVVVRGGFVSPEEAAELEAELEPLLRGRRYQFDHWDGAISGYRETERGRWGPAGRAVLGRLSAEFPPERPPRPLVHVLDLHRRGHVAPHVDSVKFCGCTLAGLSLLSAAVLRLRSCRTPAQSLELLLEPRSLYVLRGAARYEFTHEILRDEESFFGERRVPRGRRLALIYRNDPPDLTPDPLSDLSTFIGGSAPPAAPQ